jgi:hypothetical protein
VSQTIRFRPESKQAFSLYAGTLAKYLDIPLQFAQEILGRAYGYADLHELIQDLKTPGNAGPYAGKDPLLDAARNERLAELLRSRFSLPSPLPPEINKMAEGLGLFVPMSAHRLRLKELEANASEPAAENSQAEPRWMRFGLFAPILKPALSKLPKGMMNLDLGECAGFSTRWREGESFAQARLQGLELQGLTAHYQYLEARIPTEKSCARINLLLDFACQSEEAPLALRALLEEPEMQRTLSEVLEPFKIAQLKTEPWTLAYRVMPDGEILDYREKPARTASEDFVVLAPGQFAVNEAWVAFLLVEKPIRTIQGEAWAVGLMDAASTHVFGPALIPKRGPIGEAEELVSELLAAGLTEALRHERPNPRILFVQLDTIAELWGPAAQREGIQVIPATEASLLPLIGPARAMVTERINQLLKPR